jgi:hypothetical protein
VNSNNTIKVKEVKVLNPVKSVIFGTNGSAVEHLTVTVLILEVKTLPFSPSVSIPCAINAFSKFTSK